MSTDTLPDYDLFLNHSPVEKREVLVAITAAFSGLSLGVSASLQHPEPQRWLADLLQATRVSLGSTGG